MKLPISIPEGTKFGCQSCGRCCQGWTVPVDQATVDRLRTHDWGSDPFEPLRGGGGYPYRTRLVNGRCFFLDPQNRCRIHTEISYEAKPPVCRAFPLAIAEVAGRQYARLSYWCPTVQANTGRPLDQQARWLKDTSAIAERRRGPLTIDGVRELSPRQFDRIHAALRRCLEHHGLPMRDRLAAGAAIVRRLHDAAGPVVDPGTIVEGAEAAGVAALAREGANGGQASIGRRVLTLYLLHDRPAGRWSTVSRLTSILLFNAGLRPLRSAAIGARASWRGLRRTAFEPPPAGQDLLARYFCSKLDSRRYVAGESSLVTGFNILLTAYTVVEVLARMRAAQDGRSACDAEDVRHAIGAADLLVVEHPGLDYAGAHRGVTSAALGSPDVAAGLLALLPVARESRP